MSQIHRKPITLEALVARSTSIVRGTYSKVDDKFFSVDVLATLKGEPPKNPVKVERKVHEIAAFQARHRAHGLSVSPFLDVYEPGAKIELKDGNAYLFFLVNSVEAAEDAREATANEGNIRKLSK